MVAITDMWQALKNSLRSLWENYKTYEINEKTIFKWIFLKTVFIDREIDCSGERVMV